MFADDHKLYLQVNVSQEFGTKKGAEFSYVGARATLLSITEGCLISIDSGGGLACTFSISSIMSVVHVVLG